MKKNLIPTWRDSAACLDVPTELFFPIGETGGYIAQAEEAKGVCAHCPVRITCLKAALDGNEAGVWGGMSERERRNLKTKMTREDYATEQALLVTLTEKFPPCERCGANRKEKADGLCATCVTETKRELAGAEAA